MGTVNRRAELLRSLKFTLFSASAGLIQIGAFALCNDVIHLPAWLEHWLTDVKLWNDYLVTALNMVLNLVLEFLYDRFVVFRGTIDSRDAK